MGRAGGGSSRAVLRGLVPGVAGTGGALCRGCLHLGFSLLSEHPGFRENFAAGQAVFSELGFAGTGCAQNHAYQLPGRCAMRGGATAAPAPPRLPAPAVGPAGTRSASVPAPHPAWNGKRKRSSGGTSGSLENFSLLRQGKNQTTKPELPGGRGHDASPEIRFQVLSAARPAVPGPESPGCLPGGDGLSWARHSPSPSGKQPRLAAGKPRRGARLCGGG